MMISLENNPVTLEETKPDETDWREKLKPTPEEVLSLRDLSDWGKQSSESLNDVLVDRPFYMPWEKRHKGEKPVYQEKT